MADHAADLLQLAIWALGALGALIVVLVGGFVALAKWGGLAILERLTKQEKLALDANTQTNARLDAQDSVMSEIRELLMRKFTDHEIRLSVVEERCRIEHPRAAVLRERLHPIDGHGNE
jgi:hypothetical protein